jgi:DNA-directed RNA polymerase subunit RPC12/RpoP
LSGAVVITGIFAPRIGAGWFFAAVLIALLFLLRWLARAWGYRCPQCNQLFQLTMLGQFTAVNMGDERNVRCPRCGKRSWIKPFRNAG